MTRNPCPSCGLAWQVAEDNLLRRHKDEMSALRTSMLCKGCGGTVGDHLAPDQGGCPGHFVIDGVEMIPSGHRDKLRAEVERAKRALLAHGFTDCGGAEWKPPLGPRSGTLLAEVERHQQTIHTLGCDISDARANRDKYRAEVERLRADANARAVEELTKLREQARAAGANSWVGPVWLALWCHNRIEELSKPAAEESQYRLMIQTCPPKPAVPKESGLVKTKTAASGEKVAERVDLPRAKPEEPVKLDGLVIGGVKVTKDNLKCFFDEPEEPDWTVTLAAQAKVAYVNSAEPADELKVRLLSLVVEGLCHLGREVRRGGAK